MPVRERPGYRSPGSSCRRQREGQPPLPLGHVIDAVSGSVIDAHLRNTRSHWPCVAGIAKRQPPNPDQDSSPSLPITKPVEPTGVAVRLTDLDHKPRLYPTGYDLSSQRPDNAPLKPPHLAVILSAAGRPPAGDARAPAVHAAPLCGSRRRPQGGNDPELDKPPPEPYFAATIRSMIFGSSGSSPTFASRGGNLRNCGSSR